MVSPILDPALTGLNNLPSFPPRSSNVANTSFLLGAYLNLLAAGVNAAALTDHVAWVDSVNGDDATAVVGDLSHSFFTVEAAIAAVSSGSLILVQPGTYNLSAGITVPAGVVIRGLSNQNTIIQKLGVTATTTLVTMGESSSIEDITIKLTAAGHQTLTGISFPGTTTATATALNVRVIVDNSTASDGGTSQVIGIRVAATSTPAFGVNPPTIANSVVTVTSAGLGTKRGILLDTSISYMRMLGSIFACLRTGIGAGSYIGAEVNIAGGILALIGGGYNGFSADMSQTAGSLEVLGVQLTNDNANAKGFAVLAASPRFAWGTNGGVASGTRFLYPGTSPESVNEIKIRLANKGIIKSIQVRARIGPGAARVDTYTLRKNGVDTVVTTSLTAAAVDNLNNNVSVAFAATDDLSMQVVTAASSTTVDVTIVVEVY